MSELDFDSGVQLALEHLSRLEDSGATGTVLIDGRAGSGKSLFAKTLLEEFFRKHQFQPKLIAMDDLYPGWEGLIAGSSYLLEQILLPRSSGQAANWQIWDWETNRRGGKDAGNGMRLMEPGTQLIIEGCGSISASTAPLATMRIWIESPLEVRRSRYSNRDGGMFDDYFGIWSAQEDEFYQTHKSNQLADFRILN